MHLYSLTLSQATAINQSINGSFSGPKTDEIVIAKGKILQLLRLDPDQSEKFEVVHTQEVFGIVRKLMPFRLLGMSKDYIVVGSDSGRIVILEYDPDRKEFKKVV